MKYFSILILGLMITLIVSACGAKATPPPALSAVDIQNTSVAVASTMIALTQAAIPTLTPLPTETLTNTPAPTDTFLPLPSAAAQITPVLPVPTSNPAGGGGDDCIHTVLPSVLEGRTVKIRLNNSTKAAINVSVYLNQTTPEHVCGYRGYSLEPGQAISITDLVEGCYTVWAWNPDPKGYFMVTNGAADCIDNTYPRAFDISTREIRMR